MIPGRKLVTAIRLLSMSIASFDVPENHTHDYSTLSEEKKSDVDVLLPLLLTINGVKRSRFVIRTHCLGQWTDG